MERKGEKWEYKIIEIGEVIRFGGSMTIQNTLLQNGLEGWELVTVETGVAYMKRRWVSDFEKK